MLETLGISTCYYNIFVQPNIARTNEGFGNTQKRKGFPSGLRFKITICRYTFLMEYPRVFRALTSDLPISVGKLQDTVVYQKKYS